MSKNRELSQFGSFVFITDSTKSIGIATDATPYVGIGTYNATSKLHVVGDLKVAGITTSDKFIVSGGTSSGFLKANGDIDTNAYLTSTSNSLTLDFVTDKGNLTTNGIQVGVITATKFVVPSGTSSGFLKANGDIDTNAYLTSVTALTLDNVTDAGNITTNNITIGALTATGANFSGIVTATDFNSTSDITKKYNISRIEDALNIVLNLEGVRFNWIETDSPSAGVIAQQIEQYLPELVKTGDYKTVNYNGLIGVLIEAVKELKTEVEELKKKINI